MTTWACIASAGATGLEATLALASLRAAVTAILVPRRPSLAITGALRRAWTAVVAEALRTGTGAVAARTRLPIAGVARSRIASLRRGPERP